MENRRELEALDPTKANLNINKIDVLTPHKISVVLLVQQYLKVIQIAIDSGLNYPAQSRRKFCMVLLKLIQFPDMSYKDLYTMLISSKYQIDPDHLEGFEKCMHELNSLGIENLFDLFDMQNVMDKLLSEKSGISQYGIVGLYIRRIVVTLDSMTFPEMMALYKNIKMYYEKGVVELGISNDNLVNTEESILNNLTVHRDRNSHSKWSVKQSEFFIAQQCSLLETNEQRALEPIEMQMKLNEIIQDNPLFSQAHFLSYMNNLRLRDFFSSLDALHRTFDRSPVQTLNPAETRGFQYPSLNLAILHSFFNHTNEALASLKECIMLAQECGDKQCLELANSWFCILNSDNIKPNEKCIPDQTDLGMVQSVSLSIQFIVKIAAVCGYKPSELFEILLKSDELNCRNSLMELVSNSLAQRTALWTLYGKNEIASLCGQLLLKLNKSWPNGDVGNSEGTCQVLCSLALWLCIQGEMGLCNVILEHARERFPRDPYSQNWMICDCHVRIIQSIYKCKWQDGIRACCQLYIFDKNASILHRASICIGRRNLTIARQILDKLLMKRNLQPLTRVRALILLAYSMITKDYISAEVVEILNRASSYAKEKYLDYEVAIIDMMFAHVLLDMRMPEKALKIIKSCLETILANGGIYDRAKTIFVFVKCLTASAISKEDRFQRISESMEMITEAIDYFKKLEAHSKVKDFYIYLAKFYNETQFYTERNKFACKFKQYDQEFPTPLEYINVFF